MLTKAALKPLQEGKNLLAFSGGVDSSALFFLLHEHQISFDIAIVNYNTREASAQEVAYAQELAQQYHLQCHLLETRLELKNFEAQARAVRYDFFKHCIEKHGYTNLITAHQLDDRLEWFMMQLTKGAGLQELLGMQSLKQEENYTLIRPLLQTTKATLLKYLQQHQHRYFIDESNADQHYKRNYFRHQITQELLQNYSQGILKSLEYLDEDLQELHTQSATIIQIGSLYYFKRALHRRSDIITLDQHFKKMGYLIRQGERKRLKDEDEVVISRRWVVSFHTEYLFIAPLSMSVMSKEFKEQCRQLRLSAKLRPYLYETPEVFTQLKALL